MARTTLTPISAPDPYDTAGVALTFTAADVANKNQFVSTGKELVIADNTGASERTVTVESSPDSFGREADITAEAIAAGARRIYGPFPVSGWRQSDGYIYLEANNAEVEFCVIRLP